MCYAFLFATQLPALNWCGMLLFCVRAGGCSISSVVSLDGVFMVYIGVRYVRTQTNSVRLYCVCVVCSQCADNTAPFLSG